MTVKKIGVIGAGQMGHGIALVSAQAGFDVVLRDIKDEFVRKGISGIERFLNKSIEKGKITEADKKKVTNQVFNVGSETQNYQIESLAGIVQEAFPQVNIQKESGREDNRDYRVSFEKIRSAFGFKTDHIVSDAVKEIGRFVQENSQENFESIKYKNHLVEY